MRIDPRIRSAVEYFIKSPSIETFVGFVDSIGYRNHPIGPVCKACIEHSADVGNDDTLNGCPLGQSLGDEYLYICGKIYDGESFDEKYLPQLILIMVQFLAWVDETSEELATAPFKTL